MAKTRDVRLLRGKESKALTGTSLTTLLLENIDILTQAQLDKISAACTNALWDTFGEMEIEIDEDDEFGHE